MLSALLQELFCYGVSYPERLFLRTLERRQAVVRLFNCDLVWVLLGCGLLLLIGVVHIPIDEFFLHHDDVVALIQWQGFLFARLVLVHILNDVL